MSYNTETNKTILKNKKYLEKEIPKLSLNEHSEIFNIIRNNCSKYSENSRGVYVNLKFIDEKTIDKMIEFIQYSKNSKSKNTDTKHNNNTNINSKKKNDIDKFTLKDTNIHKELERLKHKNNDNFSFQSFLDKLSVTNIKEFSQNDSKIVYPCLKNSKAKFGGVKARLLKKCRDVNKSYTDNQFVNNDAASDEESDDSDNEEDDSKNKLNVMIKSLNKTENVESISDDENDF